MFSDDELIYLYRQGNEWALDELEEKFLPIIYKGVSTSKKVLENLGFDEAECISQCQLVFLQCIDYYCEYKGIEFLKYVCVKLQYALKNYERKLYRKSYYELSYETLYHDNPCLQVNDFKSDPIKMMDFHDTTEQLRMMYDKSVGLERAILACLLAGYNSKEMRKYLPYDRKTINNALYRIRKKMKNVE